MQHYIQRIFKTASQGRGNDSITYLVIRRPYAHLEEDLRCIGNVTVIVDKRDRERRNTDTGVSIERRHEERRTVKEELGEMLIVNNGA